MSHLFGVTTHGDDRPVGAASCPRILSEYHARNKQPNKYASCDLGRTAAVFPDRDLRQLDIAYGSNDGYSYGSFQRAALLRRRYLPPAEAPRDTYRLPLLTSMRYHWFFGDPALAPGYDPAVTHTPLAQCEVAERTYPPPRVAGLTYREVDRVIRLQERGLIGRATGPTAPLAGGGQGQRSPAAAPPAAKPTAAGAEAAAAAAAGASAREAPAKQRDGECTATAEEAMQVEAAERAAAKEGECPAPGEQSQQEPREVCASKPREHLWYQHSQRHPQFYSAMTRFVETVRINDKLFEMY